MAGNNPGEEVAHDRGAAELSAVAGDYRELLSLFADASPMSMSYWNPDTGELFALPAGKRRRAAAEAFDRRLLAESEGARLGWVEVPFQESDAGFAQALAFAEQLSPGRGRARLLRALAGEKPFRAFRAALHGMPGVHRKWQQVMIAEAELRLVGFCLANGWTIADDRFAAAVERWLDATEPAADPAGPHPLSARRPPEALSIGRTRAAAAP
ncbi:MAG: hypothetical protein FJ100_13645 [Deltaproteobacteria bacterium]|nr:hypothetical protein [Deltaproteobacteria bacterium]